MWVELEGVILPIENKPHDKFHCLANIRLDITGLYLQVRTRRFRSASRRPHTLIRREGIWKHPLWHFVQGMWREVVGNPCDVAAYTLSQGTRWIHYSHKACLQEGHVWKHPPWCIISIYEYMDESFKEECYTGHTPIIHTWDSQHVHCDSI